LTISDRHWLICIVAVLLIFDLVWILYPQPWLPAVLALAVPGLIVMLRYPQLIFTAFFCFSCFKLQDAYPILEPLRLPLLLGGLSIASIILKLALTRSNVSNTSLTPFLVFAALTTLSVLFARNRPVALEFWTDVFVKIIVATYGLAILLKSKDDFALFVRLFMVSGALIAMVAIWNKLNGIGLVEGSRVTIGLDIKSSLGDPNDLAFILMMPLGFCASMALIKPTRLDAVLAWICGVLTMVAITFTQSRGGFLAVATVFATVMVASGRASPLRLAISAVAVAVVYSAMGLANRIADDGSQLAGALDESAQHRLDAWMGAINMVVHRPLTGVGLNNFSDSFYFYADNFFGRDIAVHSTWFGVLAEIGVPGFVAFVWMIVAAVRHTMLTLKLTAPIPGQEQMVAVSLGLLAALAGTAVSGSFLTQGFLWPFYALVALSCGLATWNATQGRAITAPSGRMSAAGHGQTG
jgi:O-antigen ligase